MVESRKNELSRIAYQIRRGVLTAVYSASSGHPGGSLSIAEILTYLYFEEMNIDPKDPKKPDRDRFVLSKGHASPGIYSTLAHRGFFPVEDLKTFRQHDSVLQGHPDMKHIPGVDMTTGSLGLGISAACGMALGAKLNGYNNRVWTILGDGESEEGQVWEAAIFAAHYKLGNLCAFVDWNGLQIDGPIDEVISPAPFESKFEAFGWNVISIDAHDLDQIEAACNAAKACTDKPTAIIARSTKGKGVSYMENNVSWHGAAPKQEQYEQGIAELDAVIASLN